MADKITIYELKDLDGNVHCHVGFAHIYGENVNIMKQRALPSDPTAIGQWVIDQLAADET